MGKSVQGIVIALSFLFSVSICYLYASDDWIHNEKTGVIETQEMREGFWYRCTITGDTLKACDNYDLWIFSSMFPSWILAGRVLLFFAIVFGFGSTLAFMMGSRMTNMYSNHEDKKMNLRRVASVMIFLAGIFCLTAALWVFIMTARQYNDINQIAIGFGNQGTGQHKFIPGGATYGSLLMGACWLILGLMACFGSGNVGGKYQDGSVY